MQEAVEKFASVIAIAQLRYRKRLRSAILMAAVVAVLLWRTQWSTLWPGLAILLFGQVVAIISLLYRGRKASDYLHRLHHGDLNARNALTWFDTEQRFLQNLVLFENAARTTGFVVLAYGFWAPTHNLAITLALGVVYPTIAYLGLSRGTNRRTLQTLQSQKKDIQILLATPA